MSISPLKQIIAAIILLTVTACSRYSVSINENLVYQPPGLFNNYELADSALRECVRSSIAEQGLTKAEQLTRLICPEGNIQHLTGIEVFHKLEYLGMAGNVLKNIDLIASLHELKQVDISNNQIQDFTPLHALPHLIFVNALGNGKADCSSLSRLSEKAQIKIPNHC